MDLLVYGLCCIGVLVGVVLVVIGLSKPGENFLTRFAERHFKEYLAIILISILTLAIPAAAWAGESCVFSNFQKHQILEAVRGGFDDKVGEIHMDHFPDHSRIICILSDTPVEVVFFIHGLGDVGVIGDGDDCYRDAVVKKMIPVKKRIAAILNPSARDELGTLFK